MVFRICETWLSGIFCVPVEEYTYKFWMSESWARSSMRSCAMTGISLLPSRSVVTGTPLIAALEASATSRLLTPAMLARSGSISRLTPVVSSFQSSRTRADAGTDLRMSSTWLASALMVLKS